MEYRIGVGGEQAAPRGQTGGIMARDNTREGGYWLAHRLGPFMVHRVGVCEPGPNDNPSYTESITAAIDQGFAICPRCKPE